MWNQDSNNRRLPCSTVFWVQAAASRHLRIPLQSFRFPVGRMRFSATLKLRSLGVDIGLFNSSALPESYRVLCDGILIAKTDVFRLLRSVEVVFLDNTIWHCHVGILGSEVKDSEGTRILHSLPRPGLILGGSSLHIDHAVEDDRAFPLLIILMHSTTHNSL